MNDTRSVVRFVKGTPTGVKGSDDSPEPRSGVPRLGPDPRVEHRVWSRKEIVSVSPERVLTLLTVVEQP